MGYGNWMKDGLGMSEGWYTGLMVTANVAAIAINLVGVKQCFKEGTLVETEDGLKPIEEIQVGDKVLAARNKKQMIITIAVVAVILVLLVTGVLLRYFLTK